MDLKKKSGFTLIELLVAMTILAILASLSFGVYNNAQTRSRDSKRKNDVEQIGRALELYYNDFGQYPDEISTGGEIDGADWGTSFEISGEIYMKQLPEDSKSPAYEYVYNVSDDNQKYRLMASLERDDDPDYDSGLFSKTVSCGTSAICNFGISSTNASLTDDDF